MLITYNSTPPTCSGVSWYLFPGCVPSPILLELYCNVKGTSHCKTQNRSFTVMCWPSTVQHALKAASASRPSCIEWRLNQWSNRDLSLGQACTVWRGNGTTCNSQYLSWFRCWNKPIPRCNHCQKWWIAYFDIYIRTLTGWSQLLNPCQVVPWSSSLTHLSTK